MYRISSEGKKIEYWKSPHLASEDNMAYKKILRNRLVKNYGIGIQSAVIKKECFDKVGLFDGRLSMFIDEEMFIRLSYYFRFFHMKEPLVNYHIVPKSLTSSGRNKHVIATELIFKKYFNEIRKEKRFFTRYCWWLSDKMIYSKHTFAQGRKYLIMEFLAQPLKIRPLFKILLSFFGLEFYLRTSKFGHKCKKHLLFLTGKLPKFHIEDEF